MSPEERVVAFAMGFRTKSSSLLYVCVAFLGCRISDGCFMAVTSNLHVHLPTIVFQPFEALARWPIRLRAAGPNKKEATRLETASYDTNTQQLTSLHHR